MFMKYIVDMNGFTVNSKFLCKELAYIGTDTERLRSYRIKVNKQFKDLSQKDRQSA